MDRLSSKITLSKTMDRYSHLNYHINREYICTSFITMLLKETANPLELSSCANNRFISVINLWAPKDKSWFVTLIFLVDFTSRSKKYHPTTTMIVIWTSYLDHLTQKHRIRRAAILKKSNMAATSGHFY